MNKLIIGILVLAVVGGGAWMLTQRDGGATNGGAVGESTEAPENFTGSITELLALGKNVTCTFTQNEGGATVNGTVYVASAGERVRGDFAMSAEGQTMQGSVIQKDGTNYTWGETPFGPFATKVTADEPKKDKDQGVDFDDSIDYTCSPWKVDNAKFELPSGVNFDDIDPAMEKIDAAMQQVDDLKCSACDNIPDAAAKAQCKAALGCS